ncbi:unnamed protein product, partial [Owenia fusiformis]
KKSLLFRNHIRSKSAKMLLYKVLSSLRCLQPKTTSGVRPIFAVQNVFQRLFSTDDLIVKPPKKPISGYLVFMQENLPKLRQDPTLPDMKSVARKTGEMWSQLSPEKKLEYNARQRGKLEQWLIDHRAYMDSLTDEQRENIENSKRTKRHRKKLCANRRKLVKMGMPKKPLNSFTYFFKQSELERGDAPVRMFMKGAAEVWLRTPEEDKQKFYAMAAADKKRYVEEMEVWEARMIEEGHPEVVRGYRTQQSKKKRQLAKAAARLKAKEKKQVPKSTKKKGAKSNKKSSKKDQLSDSDSD